MSATRATEQLASAHMERTLALKALDARLDEIRREATRVEAEAATANKDKIKALEDVERIQQEMAQLSERMRLLSITSSGLKHVEIKTQKSVAQEAERVKNHFALIEQERTEFNEVCALVQAFQLRKDEVDLITHDYEEKVAQAEQLQKNVDELRHQLATIVVPQAMTLDTTSMASDMARMEATLIQLQAAQKRHEANIAKLEAKRETYLQQMQQRDEAAEKAAENQLLHLQRELHEVLEEQARTEAQMHEAEQEIFVMDEELVHLETERENLFVAVAQEIGLDLHAVASSMNSADDNREAVVMMALEELRARNSALSQTVEAIDREVEALNDQIGLVGHGTTVVNNDVRGSQDVIRERIQEAREDLGDQFMRMLDSRIEAIAAADVEHWFVQQEKQQRAEEEERARLLQQQRDLEAALERERELEKTRKQQKDLEIQREIEIRRELKRQAELERIKAMERELQRLKDMEAEQERRRQEEKELEAQCERHRQMESERARQKELEAQKLRELEQQERAAQQRKAEEEFSFMGNPDSQLELFSPDADSPEKLPVPASVPLSGSKLGTLLREAAVRRESLRDMFEFDEDSEDGRASKSGHGSKPSSYAEVLKCSQTLATQVTQQPQAKPTQARLHHGHVYAQPSQKRTTQAAASAKPQPVPPPPKIRNPSPVAEPVPPVLLAKKSAESGKENRRPAKRHVPEATILPVPSASATASASASASAAVNTVPPMAMTQVVKKPAKPRPPKHVQAQAQPVAASQKPKAPAAAASASAAPKPSAYSEYDFLE